MGSIVWNQLTWGQLPSIQIEGQRCASCRFDQCLIAGMSLNMITLPVSVDKEKLAVVLLNRMCAAMNRFSVKVTSELFGFLFDREY